MKSLVAFPLMLFAFAGCSSSSSSNGGGSGNGGYMAVPTVHESAAPTCNDAPTVASPITTQPLATTAPAHNASGGVIADGVYEVSSYIIYDGEGFALVDATTVVVDGASWYFADDAGGGDVTRGNRSVAASGSTITFLNTCQDGNSDFLTEAYDFTATDSGITLYATVPHQGYFVFQLTRK